MTTQAFTLHEDDAHVDWDDLDRLFAVTELHGRNGDKLRRAFQSSQAVCFVFDSKRLIGVGRALSDGEYHASIYDVAVHPDYQRQGVGSLIVRNLLRRLTVWRVMLVASSDVQPFYTRFGFEHYGDVMAKLDWAQLPA